MSADIAAGEVSVAIDRNLAARGHGSDVMDDPLVAVVWLARHLADRGSGRNGGDLVAVGSCCGLAQVLPGQTLTARLGGLGPVSLRLC